METSTIRKSAMLVGDSFFIPLSFADILQRHGYTVVSVGSEATEILAGAKLHPQIIIVDYTMSHNDPLLATAILHKALPSSHIALMNGNIQHCNEAAANSAGAQKILNRTHNALDYESILLGLEEEL
ncbi:MAG: hypothetical protein ACHQM6_01210 [Candidatus Kapaibacterium sp.]